MIHVQRSIWAGVISVACNLLVLTVLSNLISPFVQNASWALQFVQLLVLAVTFASTFFATQWYFKHASGTYGKNPTNGFIVAAVIAVVTLLLTIVPVLPGMLFVGGSISPLLAPFTTWPIWAQIGATLLAGTAAGSMKPRT